MELRFKGWLNLRISDLPKKCCNAAINFGSNLATLKYISPSPLTAVYVQKEIKLSSKPLNPRLIYSISSFIKPSQ